MENKTCSEIFSERLTELRQQYNETSRDLARALDVSFSAISNYQLGKRTPDIVFLQKVARHYNVSADYLLGLSDVKSTEQDMKVACEVTELSEKAALNIKKITSEFFHKEATEVFESNAFYWAMFHLSSALSYAKSASDYADLSEMNDENLKPFTVNLQRDEEIKNMRVCLLDVYEKIKTLSENYFKKCLKERAKNAQHNPKEE